MQNTVNCEAAGESYFIGQWCGMTERYDGFFGVYPSDWRKAFERWLEEDLTDDEAQSISACNWSGAEERFKRGWDAAAAKRGVAA